MGKNWRVLLAMLALLSIVATACASDDEAEDDAAGDTEATEAAAADDGEDTEEMAPTEDGEEMAPTEDAGSDDGAAAGGEASGTLVGAGASSQAAAMDGWVAGFQTANPDATVNYDPIGSGGGREQFLMGATTFAGSDAYLDEDEIAMSEERCVDGQPALNLPHYISPVAVAFNLESAGITELNMSPDVIGGIFAGTITNWDDEAIAADNPDAELPDLPINPVHRSDDSGTTENFTGYLEAVAPDAWTYGEVETWPTEAGGEGAPQTSGVIQAVTAGDGSIGYADASQVAGLGVVNVGVGEEFVPFSSEAAAAVVDVSPRAEGRPEGDLAVDLARDTTESGVYPIVLISYHIVCQGYESQEEVDLVKAFMTYVASEEGQQASAESAGSAPISDDLREQSMAVIDAIAVAS